MMNGRSEYIDIRKLNADDIVQLQEIGRQTFYETFSSFNTEENMSKYLQDRFSLENLTRELNDRESEFYFAELQEDVIGYLKVNFGQSQTEVKDWNALEIERIYVLKKYQGMKVGQMLYEKAIEVARKSGLAYIWLGVWDQNQRAINFYKKNGFTEFDKHLFILGDDKQTDILMKLELRS